MRSRTSRPNDTHGQNFFRDELGRVENVELELVGELLVEQLQSELPLRERAGLDGIPQVAAVEVGIGAVDLHRFVPEHRLQAELRLPVKLDEGGAVFLIEQAEGVDAEAFHEAEGSRDGPIRHDPHDHVHALRRESDEIPEGVVRRLRLRKRAVGFRLHRVDDVGKLDRVLDEEHRDVVADEIPVALPGVELDGEPAHVARQIERPLAAGDGREAHERLRALADTLKKVRPRDIGQAVGELEEAVGTVAARMHDALRDALVIEVEDLLAEMEVFEQSRAARADAQRVLVVSYRDTLLGREGGLFVRRGLVQLSALAPFLRLLAPPPCWSA